METELDDTDSEILRLLVQDGRAAYSRIADEVGMSTPAVIDRVDRMREKGVIEGFEARLDPSVLDTTRIIVRFEVGPEVRNSVTEGFSRDERVETAFVSADGTVTLVANARPEEAADVVSKADFGVQRYDVDTVIEEQHAPTVRSPSFAPECVECGNTVDEEGVSARIGGDLYHFCCTSCESALRGRYDGVK
jgi:DNA-binding Lrp family transcriptional regulator